MKLPHWTGKPGDRRLHVGMRIVKTVVAVFLCGVFAHVRGESALYSMFAALFCVQNSTGKTIESSKNRMVGTLIGGAAGVVVVHAMDALGVLHMDLLRYLVLSLLLIPIIEFSLWIKKRDAAGMACMVFLCLIVDPGNKPAIDSIERLFETLVGAALACGVDLLLPYHHMEGPSPASEPPAPEPPAAEPPAAEDCAAGRGEGES